MFFVSVYNNFRIRSKNVLNTTCFALNELKCAINYICLNILCLCKREIECVNMSSLNFLISRKVFCFIFIEHLFEYVNIPLLFLSRIVTFRSLCVWCISSKIVCISRETVVTFLCVNKYKYDLKVDVLPSMKRTKYGVRVRKKMLLILLHDYLL